MDELPDPTWVSIVMATGLRVLERRLPGLAGEMGEIMRNEAGWAAVARLHGPRVGPILLAEHAKAAAWMDTITLLLEAEPERKPRKKRRA